MAGAGPAGAVAAMVLAREGRRVLLVDEPPGDRPKVGEFLPGAVRPLLRELGLLRRLEEGSHLAGYGTVSAWGSRELRTTDSLRDPHGPGWHLDRVRFDEDLRRAAREAGAVFRTTHVRSVERNGEAWTVRCRDGAADLVAHWLVEATGRHATVARSLGLERRRDDHLIALCAWTTAGAGEDARTLVEAVPDGWWYTAGLPDGSRVVVLHVDREDARPILHGEEAWARRLAETVHVREVLADVEIRVGPQATEACGGRLERFAGDAWLAVGDAALSFDPLSSQGLLDALYSGMKGASAVHAALEGVVAPVEAYVERLERIRAAYLRHHGLYYRAERRWPDRPFWARRSRSRSESPTARNR